MLHKMLVVQFVLLVGVVVLGQPVQAAAPLSFLANGECPQTAAVEFGDPNAPPTPGNSANHNLLPNEVCITKDGSVNYTVNGFHKIAIYKVKKDTTRAEVISNPGEFFDIDNLADLTLANGAVIPRIIIDDPHQRTFLDPVSPEQYVFANPADSVTVDFGRPGRYLVICTVLPHFLDAGPAANGGMFGFVDVVTQ